MKDRFKKFFKKDFKLLLPQLYVVILVVGVVLLLLFTIFPSLQVCSNIFGDKFCTPAGLFLVMLASIPGYIIVGNLVTALPNVAIPIIFSLLLVVVVSLAIYFGLGYLIDLSKGRIKSKAVMWTLIIFAIVLIALILLVTQLRFGGVTLF